MYGNICPQVAVNPLETLLFSGPHLQQSDDCLNLSIWTPSISDDQKRPVMVWLHGGGFSGGSSIESYACDGEDALQPLEALERYGVFARILTGPAAEGAEHRTIMIDAALSESASHGLKRGGEKRGYKRRNRIEIMFGRLKDWRRVATRYDPCPETFFSAIALATTVRFWL